MIKLLRTKSLLSFDVQSKKLMTHGLLLLFYSFGLLIKSFNGKSPLGVPWFVTDTTVHFLNKCNEMLANEAKNKLTNLQISSNLLYWMVNR